MVGHRTETKLLSVNALMTAIDLKESTFYFPSPKVATSTYVLFLILMTYHMVYLLLLLRIFTK